MLHGDVKLNDVVVGEWTATRTSGDEREFAHYDCTIWFRDRAGYVNEASWQLWGNHRGNGAISLAARVLQEGNAKAKRRVMTDG